jgi:hypothetical protein
LRDLRLLIVGTSINSCRLSGKLSFHQTDEEYFHLSQFVKPMKKQLIWCIFVFCAALLSLLVSCSPKLPETREDILKWNLTNLENNYDSFGAKNPKWDKDAEKALKEFARTRTASEDESEVLFDLVGESAQSAVNVGCRDPMVRYLYACYSSQSHHLKFVNRVELFCSAASNLQSSAYPPIRKFYANVSAAKWLWASRNTNHASVWPAVRQFRYQAFAELDNALLDKSLPETEGYQAAETMFEMVSDDTYELTNAYRRLAATLNKNKSAPGLAGLIKADFYLEYAWRARGHGYASQVTQEGWRLFRERLAVAEKALDRAWAADPYDAQIPTLMISIIEGRQGSRAEMEKWFQRAMTLNPNDYQACRGKLHYLLPQWYGSRQAMLAFGRECVASTNWGGEVPLILVDAHSEFARTLSPDERRAYWTLPHVWPDIRAAYEKFARINPDLTQFRYPYAAYAFRCEQWQDFIKQIKIIRQNDFSVDYNYFGGKEDFDKMVELANSQTGTNLSRQIQPTSSVPSVQN